LLFILSYAATSKDPSQAERSIYASSRDYGSTFNSYRIVDTVDHNTNVEITRRAEDSTPVSFEKHDLFLLADYPTTYTRSIPLLVYKELLQQLKPHMGSLQRLINHQSIQIIRVHFYSN
jgi:hypothetical protein